jgi:DNA-binding CsgD family transcriptional regulator
MRANQLPADFAFLNFSEQDLGTCFQAFLADAGCAVVICDAAGGIHYANRTALGLIGDPNDQSPVGKTLHEILPAQSADSRLALIRRALECEDGNPQIGLGATDGAWRRIVVRALDRTPKSERALIVCAPLAESITMADLVGPKQAFCETSVDLGPLAVLTEREMQVLRLIGLGLSTQEIADRLHRSKKTIEWHRVSLGSKMNVTNRVELARMALNAGLTWFEEDAITHIWRHADRKGPPPTDEA